MSDTYNAADEDEYVPERGESASWLMMLDEAEKTFRTYWETCDNIGREYADLSMLRSTARQRRFALLWSTSEVVKPSIYSRPPEPVIVPRFKDRRPLYRTSSEVLERAVKVEFDLQAIDDAMVRVRDDLVLYSRGVAWLRYDTKRGKDKVCIETVDRRDFLHEPARSWPEVGWVARRCWMTVDEYHDRFGDNPDRLGAITRILSDRSPGEDDGWTRQKKIAVWEIWSRTEDKVVWVTEGVETTLDEGEPHLKLDGFYPCPRPAYGTVQPGSLIPVPDYLEYKDQAEEVNQITNRIHALASAVKVRGFYAAGAGDAAAAIERAIQMQDDNAILTGISSLSAFGQGGEMIYWMPLETIASTIAQLIEFRRAMLDDVYQIVGISDIMRGSAERTETATAQRLKAQAGSVRIRDKQAELVRVARDIVRITAEIIAENFDRDTIFSMAQVDLPSDKDVRGRIRELEQQAQQVEQQAQQQAQQLIAQAQQQPQQEGQPPQDPSEQLQQLEQQAQQQIDQIQQEIAKAQQQVTRDAVGKFLRDEKIRPYVLDVESDSTISADEDGEKQRRTEFVQALGATIQQFGPLMASQPELGPMVSEIIKFAIAPFRAGRELEGAIDEGIEAVLRGGQNSQENPEAEAARAEQETEARRMQLEEQKLQLDAQQKQADREAKMQELQLKAQGEQRKAEIEQVKAQADIQIKQLDAENKRMEMQAKQQEAAAKLQQTQADMEMDRQRHEMEMAKLQQDMRNQAVKTELDVQQAQARATAQAQAAVQRNGGLGGAP